MTFSLSHGWTVVVILSSLLLSFPWALGQKSLSRLQGWVDPIRARCSLEYYCWTHLSGTSTPSVPLPLVTLTRDGDMAQSYLQWTLSLPLGKQHFPAMQDPSKHNTPGPAVRWCPGACCFWCCNGISPLPVWEARSGQHEAQPPASTGILLNLVAR